MADKGKGKAVESDEDASKLPEEVTRSSHALKLEELGYSKDAIDKDWFRGLRMKERQKGHKGGKRKRRAIIDTGDDELDEEASDEEGPAGKATKLSEEGIEEDELAISSLEDTGAGNAVTDHDHDGPPDNLTEQEQEERAMVIGMMTTEDLEEDRRVTEALQCGMRGSASPTTTPSSPTPSTVNKVDSDEERGEEEEGTALIADARPKKGEMERGESSKSKD